MVGGHPKPHIWNQRPQFAYSLYEILWRLRCQLTDFTWTIPTVKRFSAENFQSRQKRAPNVGCSEIKWFKCTIFLSSHPDRHILAWNRVVVFCVKISSAAPASVAQLAETQCAPTGTVCGGAGVQFPGSTGRFRVPISEAHALRLISPAGKEGSTVSSIICDRWLILS